MTQRQRASRCVTDARWDPAGLPEDIAPMRASAADISTLPMKRRRIFSCNRGIRLESSDEGRERGRLRQGHDRLERQRSAMCVMAVGDASDRMTEDLN